jgi:hypothetical protein
LAVKGGFRCPWSWSIKANNDKGKSAVRGENKRRAQSSMFPHLSAYLGASGHKPLVCWQNASLQRKTIRHNDTK